MTRRRRLQILLALLFIAVSGAVAVLTRQPDYPPPDPEVPKLVMLPPSDYPLDKDKIAAWEDADYCREILGRRQPLGTIDRAKLNVVGSSLAVGHPFAATGGRIVATLAKLLAEKGSGRGLISICAAGGQAVVAIVER